MEWVRAYDTGSVEMRSKVKHDEWQKLLHCKQIVLDGAADLEDNFQAAINSGRIIREAEEKVQHNEESSFAAAFRLLDNYFKEDTKL